MGILKLHNVIDIDVIPIPGQSSHVLLMKRPPDVPTVPILNHVLSEDYRAYVSVLEIA
jgi:uncharacterized protein YfaA (DUF2138 family)